MIPSVLAQKKVYIDTNICIYLLEGFPFLEKALECLSQAVLNENTKLLTSYLTLSEVLVQPIRLNNQILIKNYRDFLEQSQLVQLTPLSKTTFIQSAHFRVLYNLKTPDSLHLSAAIDANCDIFLTNDKAFKKQADIQTILLQELIPS